MIPLRFPWLWLALGWVLVAGVLIGSLLPGNSLSAVSIHDKILHSGSYFVLMVWFAGLYERRHHIWIALVLAAFGLTLDVLQGGIATRSFELADVAANGAGIVLGLAVSVWLLGGWCQRVERHLFA